MTYWRVFSPEIFFQIPWTFSFYDDRLELGQYIVPLSDVIETSYVDLLLISFVNIHCKKDPTPIQLIFYSLDGKELETVLDLLRIKGVKINGELQQPKGSQITHSSTQTHHNPLISRFISLVIFILILISPLLFVYISLLNKWG